MAMNSCLYHLARRQYENRINFIRCYGFEKMTTFWIEVLHFVPREPAENGWVVLTDPTTIGPNISLDKA